MLPVEMVGSAWLFHADDRYYVTHDFDDDLCDLSLNANPVDELIAEPIMMLCNKGYLTNYSCSGHPYNSCSYRVIDPEKELVKIKDHISIIQNEDDTVTVCDINQDIDSETYISFKKDYEFHCLPDGWNYSNGTMRKRIKAYKVIDYYKTLLSAIEVLMKWIDNLPDIS